MKRKLFKHKALSLLTAVCLMASFLTAMAFSASADSADDPVFHLDIPLLA